MACQKVCKQGRDDMKVKVNIQNPIPKDVGIRLCIFTFLALQFTKTVSGLFYSAAISKQLNAMAT